MSVDLIHMLRYLVMPPMGPLLVILAGAGLVALHRRGGWTLFGIGWAGLYLVSLPLFSLLLAGWLEDIPAVNPDQVKASGAGAIVVISADTHHRAPEYGATTSGRFELERLRYAAYLQRHTGLPLAVIGAGACRGCEDSSVWMRSILEQEFGVPVRWITNGSYNTREDARKARQLLRAAGVDYVVLVTHAAHMHRAQWSFEREGFRVLAAPTAFYNEELVIPGWLRLLPSARAMNRNTRYLHELLGMVWYRWFY